MPKGKPSTYLPLNPDVIEQLIERDLGFVEGLVDDLKKKMLDILSDGLIKGLSSRDIGEALQQLGFDKTRAEAIARTETAYAINEAAKDSYRDSDIEYVQWLAGKDDRTCTDVEIELPDGNIAMGCAEMDGKIFKLDECPPCPAHPLCRCALSPHRGPEDY